MFGSYGVFNLFCFSLSICREVENWITEMLDCLLLAAFYIRGAHTRLPFVNEKAFTRTPFYDMETASRTIRFWSVYTRTILSFLLMINKIAMALSFFAYRYLKKHYVRGSFKQNELKGKQAKSKRKDIVLSRMANFVCHVKVAKLLEHTCTNQSWAVFWINFRQNDADAPEWHLGLDKFCS